MTEAQVRWASNHCWFLGASNQNGQTVVTVTDVELNMTTKRWTTTQRSFTNFEALKYWAGY